LIRNPILKVLSSMQNSGVHCLLMGGQACVLYGAAEFSRDTDFAILADTANLSRLAAALDDLQAKCIAVPPFDTRYLEMGLAVHFRCHHPEALNMRIDVMSKMRGVDDFPHLWQRRSTFSVTDPPIDVMALPDLVQAKKTQQDKDWPMITRLVESNYFRNQDDPSPQQIEFWFRQLRTATLLVELAQGFPAEREIFARQRPLLSLTSCPVAALGDALKQEEACEREADRRYWEPLRQELGRLRREQRPSLGDLP
jgi:hypothetical protein